MSITRRRALQLGAAAALFGISPGPARAAAGVQDAAGGEILRQWYKVVLHLVRHTATYSPPVASRAFAYLGVAAYQAVASGSTSLVSLAGQLNGLKALPPRDPGKTYSDAVITHCVMASAVKTFFGNTGPTGQRVMTAAEKKLKGDALKGLPDDVVSASLAYGEALKAAIMEWSADDGGAVIENMGFPMAYDVSKEPGHWVPTSAIRQQQFPLLPTWGQNRTFAMPSGASCGLVPPPAYSEDETSEFYRQAREVYDTGKNLTPEQTAIARFWSDDPMLSSTPPGHWIGIANDLLEERKAGLDESAEVMMRLGVAMADGFIGCWNAKFQYDLVRPVTYIKKVIDPKWEPLLITPPFPEYPSGHSTESGAAAAVLTSIYGENFAFTDRTHERDGLGTRQFASFTAAANEAGISRMYGGIHFRAAIDNGLEQGRCIAQFAIGLRTRSST
ncbi:vanadium-dependent haloperoxidase [Aestuariivirga sp.]|uniref:vanadium-dependent haloperoxidase n=1 Tax=Aestuariivirga sp. TaxID=2650926 RepID=UPI0035B13266